MFFVSPTLSKTFYVLGVNNMKTKLLSIIEKNPLLCADELAVMLDTTVETVKSILEQCKSEGIILGTKTIINWDKAGKESVSAFIELKTVPQRDKGFDSVAERIYNYPEVNAVYLISGAYDLLQYHLKVKLELF